MSEYKLTLHDSEMVDVAVIIDDKGCLLRIKAPDGNVDLRSDNIVMTRQLIRACWRATEKAAYATPLPDGARVGLATNCELGEEAACKESDKRFLDALSLGKEAREKAWERRKVAHGWDGKEQAAPSSQGD